MASKASEIESAVHTILEVLTGRQAHLSNAQADELHEAISPGYNDKPLTDEERAQLDKLNARDEQFGKGKPKGRAKAADEDEDDDEDAG